MATRRKTRKARPSIRRSRRATTRTRRTRSTRKYNRLWTREEIAFLRKYYRNHPTSWVARQLKRSVYSVRYKASDLSIRKANPSNWKKPSKGVVFGGPKRRTTTRRKTTTRGRKNTRRWAKPRRRNNRRSRW